MSKMLDATCEAGVVTADGVPVPGTDIIGEGVGASTGKLFIDGEEKAYFPKVTPDLKTTIEQAIAALEAASSGLAACSTALNVVGAAAGVPGLVLTPLLLPIDSAAGDIDDAVAELEALKDELK